MVRVEFYGVPRLRAGVAAVELESGATLGELLGDLTRRFPALGQDCIVDRQLTTYCKANFDGQRFVSDPQASLHGVGSVLILSADAGG